MPRRKPAGWPKLMVAKRLKGGVAYYWEPPTWARRAGCPIKGEALGADYAIAKQRCDELLNPQFDAWRTRGDVEAVEHRPTPGTFDWMVGIYKTMPKYLNRTAKTRDDYDDALQLASDHVLKDGRRFGTLPLASITPGAADRLHAKLKVRADGKARARTAKLVMSVCQVAWNQAWRDKPQIVPAANPFAKMGISHQSKPTRPVTHNELLRFVRAADESGESSLGTAAMLSFYWLQREVDILSRLTWGHYRPAESPDTVKIYHHKTHELVRLPLFDEDGTALWPELMDRLDKATRRGTLIVIREQPDRLRKTHLPWTTYYFRHRVAEIRAAAKLDPEAKFMGLRHGGNTEGADAGLSDAQLRALSGHRSANMPLIYARQTLKQRRTAARLRLEARTKKGNLSE